MVSPLISRTMFEDMCQRVAGETGVPLEGLRPNAQIACIPDHAGSRAVRLCDVCEPLRGRAGQGVAPVICTHLADLSEKILEILRNLKLGSKIPLETKTGVCCTLGSTVPKVGTKVPKWGQGTPPHVS